MKQGRIHRWVGRMIAVIAIAAVAACQPIIRNHGYMPQPEDLEQIIVGQDTAASVRDLIGPPSAGGILEGSGFYYVASKFRHFGALAPREIEREVLAITFAADGTVANIERFGLEEGRVVVLSRRVTDSNIRDTTLIRQLLGALGRFDAGQFIGEG